MRLSSARGAVSLLILCLWAVSASTAQTKGKPLFSEPLWLCSGQGFVAMVPFNRPQPLVVITAGDKGIQGPQTIPTTGNEVFGMQCLGSHIELRVREGESDHFSVLPFAIRGSDVEAEPREDINWSISRNGTMSSAVERRIDGFNASGANAATRGDWYVMLGGRPGHLYELHRVYAEAGGVSKFVAELLDESYDKKVKQSVCLVVYERQDYGD